MRKLLLIIVVAIFVQVGICHGQTNAENVLVLPQTNLPLCKISAHYWKEKPSPICNVELASALKGTRIWGLKLPAEMLLAADLFDPEGKPVEKTEYGKKFGQPLTQRELNDWFQEVRKGHGGYRGRFWATDPEVVCKFKLLEAFKIGHSGEYTLHVRVRLVQTSIVDASGTVRKSIYDGQAWDKKLYPGGQINFLSAWLPETVAKIQIRPEDLESANPLLNGQTSAPVKR